MWGDHVGAIMDRSDGRAARRIARSGRIIGAGGSGSGTSHPVVAGRLDQRADCGGVLRAARQRAALALDLRPRGSGGSARPQGTRPGAGQGAGCSVGDRGSAGAGRIGSAELDLAALGRRDREANRRAHLEIAAQRGGEKGGFACCSATNRRHSPIPISPAPGPNAAAICGSRRRGSPASGR